MRFTFFESLLYLDKSGEASDRGIFFSLQATLDRLSEEKDKQFDLLAQDMVSTSSAARPRGCGRCSASGPSQNLRSADVSLSEGSACKSQEPLALNPEMCFGG